jgi:hypothetical protein
MVETLRELSRKNPRVTGGIGACLVALCVAAAWATIRGRSAAAPTMASRLYFSDDDGKTFFTDDSARIAPFDHNGRTAYQAAVFRCGGGPPFVGYLLCYGPATKAELEALPEADRRTAKPAVLALRVNRSLVRKPGTQTWLHKDGEAPIGKVVNPPCPDGSDGRPVEILP